MLPSPLFTLVIIELKSVTVILMLFIKSLILASEMFSVITFSFSEVNSMFFRVLLIELELFDISELMFSLASFRVVEIFSKLLILF